MSFLTASGMRFYVQDAGHGSPLLLVHGFPLDHSMWSPQVEAFSDTQRVVVPDLRGFGRSDATVGTVTMAQFADDLAAILDELGILEPVALCGLSMGGYVAWQFHRRHPQRLRSLILCDTRAAADTPEGRRVRLVTADRVLIDGPGFLAESMPEKLFAEQTRKQHPELIAATQRVIESTAAMGIAAASRGMAERPDVTGELSDIDVPTLVIVGEHDPISPPAEMRTIADRIRNAEYVEITGAGHMSTLEAPETVNAAIKRFLQRS